MSESAARAAAWRQKIAGTEPPYHGTRHIYAAYGCRCDECRAAARRTGARARQRSYQPVLRGR